MIIDAKFTESHSQMEAKFGTLAKGEKGDAFKYEDFTDEQLEDLRCTDRWDNHETRITNLEQRLYPKYFSTDDTIAYKKIAHLFACPYAQINYIGGATYEGLGEILLDKIYTVKADEFGYVAGGDYLETVTLSKGKYYCSLGDRCEPRLNIIDGSIIGTQNGDFELNEDSVVEILAEGIGEFSPNEEVTVPLSLRKYECLPTKTTAIKVHGNNLMNFPYNHKGTEMGGGYTKDWVGLHFEVKEDGSVVVNGTATGTPVLELSNVYTTAERDLYFSVCPNITTENPLYYAVCYREGDTQINEKGLGAKIPKGSKYKIGICISKGCEANNLTFRPMVTYGDIKQPYRPPNEAPSVFDIPESITSMKGYGEANPNNAEEYNFVDAESQEFVAVGYIEDGIWEKNEEPIRTPIVFDKFIEVDGACPIEFVNEGEIAVPSSITYLLKEA